MATYFKVNGGDIHSLINLVNTGKLNRKQLNLISQYEKQQLKKEENKDE